MELVRLSNVILMRLALLLISGASLVLADLKAEVECRSLQSCLSTEGDDSLPLLQITRSTTFLSTKTAATGSDYSQSGDDIVIVPVATHAKNLNFSRHSTQHGYDLQAISGQAMLISAAIMLMMTVAISAQLILIEYILAGTCAIPRRIAGIFHCASSSLLSLLFAPLQCLGRCLPVTTWLRRLVNLCCQRQSDFSGTTKSLTDLPETALGEVAACLPIGSLCLLGVSCKTLSEVTDGECSYKALLSEVSRRRLEVPWADRLQKLQEAEHADPADTTKTDKKLPEFVSSSCKERNLKRELRLFLCAAMHRSAEEEQERYVEESWNVMMDVLRFLLLLVSWLSFSGEVMTLACSTDANDLMGVLKALISPCVFLFILECDRENIGKQAVAGAISALLLVDISLHDRWSCGAPSAWAVKTSDVVGMA